MCERVVVIVVVGFRVAGFRLTRFRCPGLLLGTFARCSKGFFKNFRV